MDMLLLLLLLLFLSLTEALICSTVVMRLALAKHIRFQRWFFVGFSFLCAEYLCVAGPYKLSSSLKVWILKYVFDRAHVTRTRPRF